MPAMLFPHEQPWIPRFFDRLPPGASESRSEEDFSSRGQVPLPMQRCGPLLWIFEAKVKEEPGSSAVWS